MQFRPKFKSVAMGTCATAIVLGADSFGLRPEAAASNGGVPAPIIPRGNPELPAEGLAEVAFVAEARAGGDLLDA